MVDTEGSMAVNYKQEIGRFLCFCPMTNRTYERVLYTLVIFNNFKRNVLNIMADWGNALSSPAKCICTIYLHRVPKIINCFVRFAALNLQI